MIKEITKEELDKLEKFDFNERVVLIDEPVNNIQDFRKWQKKIAELIIFSRHNNIKIRPALVFEQFHNAVKKKND